MSIQTANFLVSRDGQEFRCRGSELKSRLNQFDLLLVQRNTTQYRTKLAINLDTIQVAREVQVDLDYKQYAFCRNRATNERLAENSPPFANAQQELRVYENIFDGDSTTRFKSYTNSGIKHDVVIKFPETIDVYESITIRAGFHYDQRLGQMLVNGAIVRELSAWDGDPQDFTVGYTGPLDEFSIRQVNLANNTQCTAVINYIDIDGKRLVSKVNTTQLTMAAGTDMSRYSINMRLKKTGTNITGVIGSVDARNRIITLTEPTPFSAGDEILIDQIDGIAVNLPEILDTDLFVCTDDNDVTYRVNGQQFKSLFM